VLSCNRRRGVTPGTGKSPTAGIALSGKLGWEEKNRREENPLTWQETKETPLHIRVNHLSGGSTGDIKS